MSMQYYGFHEYGMALNGLADNELLADLAEDDVCESQFSFSGEVFPLDENGMEKWCCGNSYSDAEIYYISASRRPMLFATAYVDMHDLVEDLYRKYVRAVERSLGRLPEITREEVRKRVRSMQGVYFG